MTPFRSGIQTRIAVRTIFCESTAVADAMNYNRRTTRPDALYYRESRKRSPAPRRARRAGMIGPLVATAILCAIGLAAWLLRG